MLKKLSQSKGQELLRSDQHNLKKVAHDCIDLKEEKAHQTHQIEVKQQLVNLAIQDKELRSFDKQSQKERHLNSIILG